MGDSKEVSAIGNPLRAKDGLGTAGCQEDEIIERGMQCETGIGIATATATSENANATETGEEIGIEIGTVIEIAKGTGIESEIGIGTERGRETRRGRDRLCQAPRCIPHPWDTTARHIHLVAQGRRARHIGRNIGYLHRDLRILHLAPQGMEGCMG